MDSQTLINGLMFYLGLVILLTFHEYGHAWMAWKCGDDTAKDEGRLSLNPLVHLDPIGTGLIPLIQIFNPAFGRFLLGWAKPVPVNLNNLRHPVRDDILVSLAGPAMNVILAVGLIALAKVLSLIGISNGVQVCGTLAHLSLLLCFFNLLPIPPLDGSHVMRVIVGMDYRTYLEIAQYGFILIIVVLNFLPWVGNLVGNATYYTWLGLAKIFALA